MRGRAGSAVVLVILLGTHLFFLNEFASSPNPNVRSRVYLTLAMVDDGSLSIDGCLQRYGATDDLAEYNGHRYTDKAPGYSMLLAPIAWAARHAGVAVGDLRTMSVLLRVFGLSIPTALFWFFTRRHWAEWAGDERRGDAVMLAGALGGNFFIYSTQLFSHVPAAIFLYVAFRLARSGRGALATGTLLGLAFACDYLATFAAAVLAVSAILVRRERRVATAALVGAGLLVVVLPWMAYNRACFGSPLSVGFHHHANPKFAPGYQSGLFGMHWPAADAWAGMFFGARRGWVFFSPFLALAALGWWRLARDERTRRDTKISAAAAISIWAFAMTTLDWTGGWSVSVRYLVPALPFALVGVAGALRGVGMQSATMVFFGVGAVVGILHTAAAAATFPAFPPEFDHPIAQLALPVLGSGYANSFILVPNAPMAVTIPFFGLVLLAVAWIARNGWRGDARTSLLVAVMAAAIIAAEVGVGGANRADVRRDRSGVLRRMGHACGADALLASVLRDRFIENPADLANAAGLARLRAASPCGEIRDGAEAVRLAERVTSDPRLHNPVTMDLLASAYAEAGRFDDAIRAMREAIAMTGSIPNGEVFRQRAESRLRLYESHQPYRDPAARR